MEILHNNNHNNNNLFLNSIQVVQEPGMLFNYKFVFTNTENFIVLVFLLFHFLQK